MTITLPDLSALRKRRLAELAAYFFYGNAHVVGNHLLREPQEESYLALRKFFRRGERVPALIEIPTGCGKTGIMCIAPFRLAKGRVLVVVPNLTVRDTVVRALAGDPKKTNSPADSFYLKFGIFETVKMLPKVSVLERGRTNMEDCLRADIVVANIQLLVNRLGDFDDDFFNFIIVDEAHHVPAESWQVVNSAFPDAFKLYLTATPFRSDNQSLSARLVYRYSLRRAVQNEYVKNVARIDAVASRVTFQMEGEVRELTTAEIADMSEQTWFSRGVALSGVCNRTIAATAAALLSEKRKGGFLHQMLAAACSIRHAEELVELFQSMGVRTSWVVSEGLSREERDRRLHAFEQGRFDCMVQVGILGEGYDVPNVSVAAMFRPYRTLSPYAQFVGRTLRRIEDGSALDNLAHVVGHVGLNLDPLWNEFKSEKRRYRRSGDEANEDEPRIIDEEEPSDISESFIPEILEEYIDGYRVDSFLPCEAVSAGFRKLREGGVMSMPAVVDAVHPNNTPRPVSAPEPRRSPSDERAESNRPDLERFRVRQKLNREIHRAAGFIMHALRFAEEDEGILRVLGEKGELTDFEVIVRGLNRFLNQAMKKDESVSHREDWTTEELEKALTMVRPTRDVLLFKIRLVVGTRRDRNRLF